MTSCRCGRYTFTGSEPRASSPGPPPGGCATFPFLVTISRVLGAIWRGLRDPAFRHVLAGLIVTLMSGTVFYSAVEGWSLVDSIYFCVMTLSTVGYGDLHPTTPVSKIFTVVFLFVGAGIFVSFITKLTAERRTFHLPHSRHHDDESGG